MKKILLYSIVPLIVSALLFTCGSQESKDESEEAVNALDESTIPVTLIPVEAVTIAKPVLASGLLATRNESRLSFKIGGVIRKVLVREGQTVQKGQTLASLDLTEINAQVNQAINQVEKLKRDIDRVQRLFKDSAATLEMVQNIQTAYDVAIENKAIAEFNREYAVIIAPASGKILRKFVNEGELVGPGTPTFFMNSAGQNEWIIKLAVADVDWARLKLGDKVKIALDIFPDESLNGEVSLIGEGADSFTGLYPIEVSVSSRGKRLASGLFAKVEIIPSVSLSLHQIPVECLVEGNGDKAYVFVPESDQRRVRKIRVSIAFVNENYAYVSAGLDSLDKVIESGSGFLTSTSIVTIGNL